MRRSKVTNEELRSTEPEEFLRRRHPDIYARVTSAAPSNGKKEQAPAVSTRFD